MGRRVTVYEVGPRDGLQNEAAAVATGDKLALVAALAGAGLSRIEATSFVSPRWIPQLADGADVVAGLPSVPGVSYVVLVPNAKGLDRLVEALGRAGAGHPPVAAAVFLSASETHNRKNLNRTPDETLRDLESLVPAARGMGLDVRGYVSTVWGCPYEGAVDPARAASIVERLLALGCHQVSLGDTIGVGNPEQTRRILERLLRVARPDQLALHMHDTRGTALANVLAGLDAGITTFDASIGGLGGCPYAPGASGNLATEDLVYMLHGMGYETGIDWTKLIAAGALAERLVGRRLPGKALQAELARAEAR
ncbi:hydroxymethylglutaryl-CoA lyase [Anaeromyxobacter oryzae]|uniref:Hydroxymethylglutaryl-CoA lyase n=1 Tax=Anaeromyxobacter oryzae TaxID=2918170 RepID=A0ABM7X3W9_9BACT|nr:hydroxymethylglutaryl-CoA lyase [Anaeromyxobacter oryzae]BDG06504.1 hydroxymethylglutaryl-CoA lyase [Anaeromyxobacter oryzae]